jgi:hypothetical protein
MTQHRKGRPHFGHDKPRRQPPLPPGVCSSPFLITQDMGKKNLIGVKNETEKENLTGI